MEDNTKYDVAVELISDILSQQDVSLSVNSGSGIAELKIETELPFRINDKWATIGDDNKPWHLHLNMDEVVDARFVKETRSDGRQSYSIRFFDSIGHLAMRVNFIKLYDNNGNLIMEKAAKFDEIYAKYGEKEILSLRGQ
ncbi:MAG: ChuX/HutX family heme-like substrate-binding protein [Candidatus Nitrosopolaris sp.]|jgi:putative heme iron utilization protein